MNPTEILMSEHRVIEQVLESLIAMADQFAQTNHLEAEPAQAALDFLKNFADGCHHGKEEARLFPAMERRGFSPQCGPTAVMRTEHDDGRACVRAMSQAIEAAERGEVTAPRTFSAHARAYVQLLREHIHKEDHCLFPMANQALSQADQKELSEAFETFEREDMEAGAHERYLAIAAALASRYGNA